MFSYIKLDRESLLPLHHQLKSQLEYLIRTNVLKENEYLPSEAAFCQNLCVSRAVVRQAVGSLAAEGYLVRQKGKGTVVRPRRVSGEFFSRLESFSQEFEKKGLPVSTKVIRFSPCPADSAVCTALALPCDAPLLLLARVRCANGQPLVYVQTWLSAARFHALLNEDMETCSLYELLESVYGVRVCHAHRRFTAAECGEHSQLLACSPHSPVCLVHTTGYDQDDAPVEYSVAWYRGDCNQFEVDLYR